MTKFLSFFANWHGDYRETLPGVSDGEWISPGDALKTLEAANSETPMPHRQFLVWKAKSGSLPSISKIIYDEAEGEIVAYRNIVLSDEWHLLEWQSAQADLWTLSSMRMFKVEGSSLTRRRFTDIAFGRREIEEIADSYPPQENLRTDTALSDDIPTLPWTEDEMSRQICASGFTNRDSAWNEHFEDRQNEHGWTISNFRAHWSTARGTKGMKGRPAK